MAGSRRPWWGWRDRLLQGRRIHPEIRSDQRQLDPPPGPSSRAACLAGFLRLLLDGMAHMDRPLESEPIDQAPLTEYAPPGFVGARSEPNRPQVLCHEVALHGCGSQFSDRRGGLHLPRFGALLNP